jgi:hypothetical protein
VSRLGWRAAVDRTASNINHKVPSRLMASLAIAGSASRLRQTCCAAWELVGLKMTPKRSCVGLPRSAPHRSKTKIRFQSFLEAEIPRANLKFDPSGKRGKMKYAQTASEA